MPYRTFHIRHRPSYADVIRNCCIDQYASDVFITDIPSCTLCITLCSSNNTFNQILLACESLHASYATSWTLPACRATEQLSHCSVLTGYTGGYLATSSSIWILKIQICYVPSSTKGMYVCICIRHEAHMNRRLRSTERQTNKQTYRHTNLIYRAGNWVNYLLQFLSELTRFFQKSKAASKSVQLTMKKCKDVLFFCN